MPRTPQAQHLLDFLVSVSGTRIIAGQHNYITVGSKYTDLVEQTVGKRPLLWGSDFAFYAEGDVLDRHYHCGPLNISDPGDEHPVALGDATVEGMRDRMTAEAIAQHERGHIITIMWHAAFPADGDSGPYSSIWKVGQLPSDDTWASLTTEGSELHEAWLAQVDRVAVYLKRLRDEGIPVLWRPYHELNGVWFWWCNRPGDQGIAKLWRMMHDRYTDHHGLDNLLWVYNTNAPRDRENDEAYAYDLFYPGHQYVDVLAADVYGNDYRQSHHDDLAALGEGKPIALGEVGEMPTPELLMQQPKWSWFMPWGCLALRRNNVEKLPVLYADARVVALADVERDAAGVLALRS